MSILLQIAQFYIEPGAFNFAIRVMKGDRKYTLELVQWDATLNSFFFFMSLGTFQFSTDDMAIFNCVTEEHQLD